MGEQSTPASPPADDTKPQNPAAAAHVMENPLDVNKNDPQYSRDEDATEALKRSISARLEQPMREEQVQNAVKFLSHPKVRGSPVIYRRSFLEKKGLTREEIDEAFRRVPDPPSTSANVEASGPTQGSAPSASKALQLQVPSQNVPTAIAPSSIGSMAAAPQKTRFLWSHVLIAVGVIATSGAGTAVFFKKAILPRLKAWIREVAKGEDHVEKKDISESKVATEAAQAAQAAASAAAVVAKACQDLLNANSEEKKNYEAFMRQLDLQMKEIKSLREVMHSQEKNIADVHSAADNGPMNNVGVVPHVEQSASRKIPINSQEQKLNVKSTPATAPSESTATSYPKSYLEVLAMIQRGETPPGIKEINDMPPNPNQQPSNPHLAPKKKPWEATQQLQQNSYGQLQDRVDGTTDGAQENGQSSQSTGHQPDGSESSDSWWNRKTTFSETEQEAEPRLTSHGVGSKNWPGRGWVPPQTPSVAMPEAAEAIRKPKPPAQKQQTAASSSSQSSDREDEMTGLVSLMTGAKSSGGGIGNAPASEALEDGQSQLKDDPPRKLKRATITEIEPEAGEPRLPSYGNGSVTGSENGHETAETADTANAGASTSG